MKIINEIGNVYGRLRVISITDSKNNRARWLCECSCGKKTIVDGSSLRRGDIKSCGCLKNELTSKRFKKHGLKNHKLYGVRIKFISRCYNNNDKDYKNYGGRNIKVCKEWRNDFKTFYDWSLNNGYKEGLTIERIDVNGNYSPNNCKWIHNSEQSLNWRRSLKFTYKNETKDIRYFSNKYNIKYNTLRGRLQNGWSISDAIEIKPIKGANQHGIHYTQRLSNKID